MPRPGSIPAAMFHVERGWWRDAPTVAGLGSPHRGACRRVERGCRGQGPPLFLGVAAVRRGVGPLLVVRRRFGGLRSSAIGGWMAGWRGRGIARFLWWLCAGGHCPMFVGAVERAGACPVFVGCVLLGRLQGARVRGSSWPCLLMGWVTRYRKHDCWNSGVAGPCRPDYGPKRWDFRIRRGSLALPPEEREMADRVEVMLRASKTDRKRNGMTITDLTWQVYPRGVA